MSFARVALVIGIANVGGCHACLAVLLSDDDSDGGHAATAQTATAAPTGSTDPAFVPLENTTATTSSGATTAQVGQGTAWSGRYACLQLRITVLGGVKINYVPGAIPPFTINGATYESGGTTGTVSQQGPILAFTGGNYDGWRGYTGTDSSGAFVQFKNGKPAEPEAHLKHMDFKCYRQKG